MDSTVAELRREGYDIRTLDVRRYMSTARQYNVRALPTFIYVVEDAEVRRTTGPMSKDKLKELWRPGSSWF